MVKKCQFVRFKGAIFCFGFCAKQIYCQIEGNHNIYTWEDRILSTCTKDVIRNKEGSRMVKDGED